MFCPLNFVYIVYYYYLLHVKTARELSVRDASIVPTAGNISVS